jgi:hypothetical protein
VLSLGRLRPAVRPDITRKASTMELFSDPRISVESWVEMRGRDIPMRYETDSLNDHATLYFGPHDEYVMVVNRDNLRDMANLGLAAAEELDRKRAKGEHLADCEISES